MKKINRILLAGVALLGFVACDELEHSEFVPENAVAPVLNSIEVTDQNLAEGAVYATVRYTPADYGFRAASKTALYADVNADFSKEKSIAEGADGLVTVKGESLNNILVSAGIPSGEETTIYFRLKSTLQGESSAVGGASGVLTSEAKTATAIGYDAAREYPKVWVLGSFNSWSHATAQFLYNYGEDEVKYQGVIDFGEDHASNEFKLTGVAGWDGPGNWGIANAADAPESSQVELLDGSNDNISQFKARRYYHFSFSKPTLILKVDYSFDQVGIIGLNGDWDNDVVMTYDPASSRFYADVTVPEKTEFKYRLDAAWGTNWGGSLEALSNGGDNIPIEAGNYRIYLSLGNNDAVKGSVSAEDYGKEISGPDVPPEPEVTVKGWAIIGDFNSWGGDVVMTNVAGYWTGYVDIAADGGFKIRKDGDWAESRGGVMNSLGEDFHAEADNGANINVAAGFYKVVYDELGETLNVSQSEVWGLIGGFNDWGGDVDMVLKDGKWVSLATSLPAGEFKIRHNHGWAADRGGAMTSVGEAFEAAPGGANIALPEAGVYTVTYDPSAETILVEKLTDYWGLIGTVDGSNWDKDVYMTFADGVWTCEAVLVDSEFKLRFNADWSVNRGGSLEALGTAFSVAQEGPNIAVERGRYSVTYDPSAETVTVAAL